MDGLAENTALERLRRWDERRPSFPGEHWFAAAIGAYLLLRPRRSVPARIAAAAAGALFLMRALSGRDGPLAALERRSREADARDEIEVAAPWPYSRRVRISTPRRTRYGIAATPERGHDAALAGTSD